VNTAWGPPAADDRSTPTGEVAGRSVCVFCSSAGGLPEAYRQAAHDLGRELAERGHRLVYGGGNVGLMGELARSVHEHGGTVVGVIPQGLVDRELAYDPADELLVTQTLRDHNDTFLGKSSWSSARWPCSASGCGSGARPSPSRSPLPTTRPAPASRPGSWWRGRRPP
jgi:SLOG cluster4 family